MAYALERRLFEMGRAVTVLDGRRDAEDHQQGPGRSQRRSVPRTFAAAIDVARYMNEAGLICICAFVAPSEAVRERARQAIGAERFVEIALSAPLETCGARDTEDMYRRADAGEMLDFPGVTAVYEIPIAPTLTLDAGALPVEVCVNRIVERLAPWLTSGEFEAEEPGAS